ncbi:hypothetical protein O181_118288, partial [Austropuccinia psidii MF-1]|nr:hypothetical protein [Austropuccinia psidii MF-1]
NPTEDNQTTVETLVEEACPSSPTPIVIKKKKDKKLDFPGPTIQDYEEEVPNTSYNQMELDSEVELIPQKGKERQKSPVEQNPHKEVPYPKEGSNRHLHEPVQAVLHSVQGQRPGNAATNTPRSDERLAPPQKITQRGGNSEILQWIESTIIQTSSNTMPKRRRQPRKKPQ